MDVKNTLLKTEVLLAVIVLLLLVNSYGFITGFITDFNNRQKLAELSVKNESFNAGVIESIKTIWENSQNCTPVSLTYNQQTKDFVDTACAQGAYNKGGIDSIQSLVLASKSCSIATVRASGVDYKFVDYACVPHN